ncbi:MAG: hypothetical protein Q8900_02215 [Bacillota bacterium]|nr:hypothetical protein [Bacillota bacterium]
MRRKIKGIALAIIIMIIILMVHSLFNYILIPKIQKEKVLKSFTENTDKFESVHNYICKTYPISTFYSIDFSKSGDSNQADNQIKDRLVLQQMQYIFKNLHFEYIENIQDDTHFVFKDANGHFQSIDFTTDDITRFKDWNTIKLKENWYYRSI